MPEEIRETLNRVAGELPSVDWLTPAQLRSRAQRARRERTAVAAVALVLVLIAGAGLARSVIFATPSTPAGSLSCPDELVTADLRLLPPEKISLNVLNGTRDDGLAALVADQLRNRGFAIESVGNASEPLATGQVAVIRYGPRTVGAAWVLRSYLRDAATIEFDIDRRDLAVDLVLGTGFQSIATPTEVNRWIASLGRAVAPPGTCGYDVVYP